MLLTAIFYYLRRSQLLAVFSEYTQDDEKTEPHFVCVFLTTTLSLPSLSLAVSPEFIQDGEKTEQYFIDFVKKLPDGVITADDVQPYGPEAYLHTGMYTFMTGPEDARAPVEARFSYMWRIIEGDWKIVHHHSSAVPKVAGAAEAEASEEKMYPLAQVLALYSTTFPHSATFMDHPITWLTL